MRMKLFERAGGRLRPTPEAEALMPDVAEIFGRIGALERMSQDLAAGARGAFSIAATPPLCDGFVAKAVATFVAMRPGVKVSLHSMPTPLVLDRVLNREVDLGVSYEPVVSAAVDMEEVMRAPIGCVMPARHPLAKRRTIRIRDLQPYPVVTYLPQALLRPYIDRALSDKKTALRITVETSLSSTGLVLAWHGAGITLMETALFAARPLPGFVARPLEPRVELKGLLLRPRGAHASLVLTDFIAHLKTCCP